VPAIAAGGVLFLAAAMAWLGLRSLNMLFGRAEPTAPERVAFLGGSLLDTHAWSRYHARYYSMALLFLAFDMEMVFMYPWAVVFVHEGIKALIEMVMFIAILTLGIVYAWREKALDWS
jgi:NADH:ubiquinone oxidoreductase subunit 3 (subunit A)